MLLNYIITALSSESFNDGTDLRKCSDSFSVDTLKPTVAAASSRLLQGPFIVIIYHKKKHNKINWSGVRMANLIANKIVALL